MPNSFQKFLIAVGFKKEEPRLPKTVEEVIQPLTKLLTDLNALENVKLAEAANALDRAERLKAEAAAARSEADLASIIWGKLNAIVTP